MFSSASFFAGVGGIDYGFCVNGIHTIYANEFDSKAIETYELNFPDVKVDARDIREVQAGDVPDFDILHAGFPCQPFSIAGYRQGFDDDKNRGNLFFELLRFISAKNPRVLFLENVKNLVGHDNGNTFRVIYSSLENLGYKVLYQVMNAKEYGNVPQNRERIYIVGFREKKDYSEFEMPSPIPLTRTIRDVIDFEGEKDEEYYYKQDTCPFYHIVEKEITKTDTIYQWRRVYVRENRSSVVPTLTANMGSGGHNVPLILTDDKRIRKLTPRECFNVQGFPDRFMLPNQSNCHLYKQAGNTVVIPVVERIARNIRKALEINQNNRSEESPYQSI